MSNYLLRNWSLDATLSHRKCYLSIWLVALFAIFAVMSPAAGQSSFLEKSGVNVQTGSTTSAASGDTIHWVVSSTNPSDRPVQATITDPIQSAGVHQTYVSGSFQAPPGFTPEWSTDGGTTFSTTDQGASTDVLRASNANVLAPATAIGAFLPRPLEAVASPTGGDGLMPILFTSLSGTHEVWNIFHHTPGSPIVCTDLHTNARCAGGPWPKSLSTVASPFGSGPNDVYSQVNNTVVTDPGNPSIIWSFIRKTTNPQSYGALCINLELRATCGYTPLTTDSQVLNANPGLAGTEIELVGTKIYGAVPPKPGIVCFDTATQAPCVGQPYAHPSALTGNGYTITPPIDGQIFGWSSGAVSGGGFRMEAWCFDAATNAACAGWSPPNPVVASSAQSFPEHGPKLTTYDADGVPTGMCVGSSRTLSGSGFSPFTLACFDLAGVSVAPPAGFQLTLAFVTNGRVVSMEPLRLDAPNGHAITFIPLVQSGSGFANILNGGTICYDWTTQSPCDDFPSDLGIPGFARHSNVNGGNTRDYAYDGQCAYGLGDAGWLFSFDPVTGLSPCSKTQAILTLDPSAYYCDGVSGHIQGYDAVSLKDIDLSTVDFASTSVTVRDGNGNVLGTFPFDPMTGKADISSISVTTTSIVATLDIALVNSSSFTATNRPRAEVSFIGSAPQMCFRTVVSNDCATTQVSNQASATYTDDVGTISDISPLVTFTVTGAVSAADATHGSAYGVDVAALGVHLLDRIGAVGTADPGGPSHAARQILSIPLPGLVNLGVITTNSDSLLSPPPSTSSASAEIANVNLLGGLITASAVKAVSQSVASTHTGTYSSDGSGFVNLKINGQPITNIAPNTTVQVKNPLLPTQIIAAAHLYEETGSRAIAGGQVNVSHSVNMMRIVLIKPFLTLPAGAEIVVSHAESDVVANAACSISEPLSVSGEAFTAFVDGTLAGQQLVGIKVGDAVLPSQGGADRDGTPINLPSIVTSGTTLNTTEGSVDPNPQSASHSVVQGVNILSGLVAADVLDVASDSSADGSSAGATFAVTFTNLKVGSVLIPVQPAPNTSISVPSSGGLIRVVLNEQVSNTNGTTDTEGTVNAIHLYAFDGSGLFTGEVIVSSAHSDAHK